MTFESYIEDVRYMMNNIVPEDNATVNVDSIKDAKQAFAEICNDIARGNNGYEKMKKFLENVANSLIHDKGGKINHILDDTINGVITETLSRCKTSGLVNSEVKDDKEAEVIKEEKVEEKIESKKDEKSQKPKIEKKEEKPTQKEEKGNPIAIPSNSAQIGSCVDMPNLVFCTNKEQAIVMNRIKTIANTIKSGNSKWDKNISESFANLTLVHFWHKDNDFILQNTQNGVMFWIGPKRSASCIGVNDPARIRAEHDEYVRTLIAERNNNKTKSA